MSGVGPPRPVSAGKITIASKLATRTDGGAPHAHGAAMRPPVWEQTGGRTAVVLEALVAALTAATVLCRYDGRGGGH
eukprot:6066473-Pleurochrysis_carterae.AAC.1